MARAPRIWTILSAIRVSESKTNQDSTRKHTLSPPDYSLLEDLSSGELRSRTQQVSNCYDIIWQR
ncbi:hypothetical protein KIN20_008910 [Parelaphostrongylus tenuis]|uniref:Uncharacterized protein n=1 Tax=Parelaphostrongylus tenuis TaxID=148309 RepID=A0AAD5MNE1_PARTN|nr:hypothetical protein KIN20_008910 [Parelaphostrongylus tenuis]